MCTYLQISTEKTTLQKKLKGKEVETKDLLEVINRLNSNNLDLDKLYDVSHIKAEATALLEERNELKVRLVEVEGAHHLLEGIFSNIIYINNYMILNTCFF